MEVGSDALSWSDVFTRSSIALVVFNVRKEYQDRVSHALTANGLAVVKWTRIEGSPASSGVCEGTSTAVLDGMVLSLDSRWGLPVGDDLNVGMRVVGMRPLRLLSHLLGLRQPTRRLKGEESLVEPTELVDQLTVQVSESEEDLRELANDGVAIWTISDLQHLVIDRFGEAAVPEMSSDLKASCRVRENGDKLASLVGNKRRSCRRHPSPARM